MKLILFDVHWTSVVKLVCHIHCHQVYILHVFRTCSVERPSSVGPLFLKPSQNRLHGASYVHGISKLSSKANCSGLLFFQTHRGATSGSPNRYVDNERCSNRIQMSLLVVQLKIIIQHFI